MACLRTCTTTGHDPECSHSDFLDVKKLQSLGMTAEPIEPAASIPHYDLGDRSTEYTCMVKQIPVRTFREKLYCKCGGEMRWLVGSILTGNPATYSHKCDRCGEITYRPVAYPRIVHKDVD